MKLPENMYPKKTDTPRTDAAHDPTSPENLYFEARKMEKELTAAQERAERLRVERAGLVDAATALLKACNPMEDLCEVHNASIALLDKIESLATPSVQRSPWLPIESAPRDGTLIDVWSGGEFPGRWSDVFWGKPDHECGESGDYCDSDWHGAEPGWVCSTFQEFLHFKPTHWMPLPSAPETKEVA